MYSFDDIRHLVSHCTLLYLVLGKQPAPPRRVAIVVSYARSV